MIDLAREQHGVVTRKQLLALGISRHAVTDRLGRGILRALYPGVFVVGGSPQTPSARRMAAVLACGLGAVLSHRSAARLWGVFPYDPGRIEVSRPMGRSKHRGILFRRARLLPDEIDEVDGIPITSVFRTIFDLAAICSKREVERAFHETEVRQLTDRVSLPQLLARHPGRRGAAMVRELLASPEPAGITENDFEEEFVAFLDSHGIKRPLFNATLPVRGRLLRPDCMWPAERLVAELDGRAVHGTDRHSRAIGSATAFWWPKAGRAMHVTWLQLRDEPEAIAADLREALGRQSRHAHPHGR